MTEHTCRFGFPPTCDACSEGSTIYFAREYDKIKRFVYRYDDTAVPDKFDALEGSIMHATAMARRYLKYADLARRVLADVQRTNEGLKDE